MGFGENDFDICGGARTVNVLDAWLLIMVPFAFRYPLRFGYAPAVDELTSTTTVHELLAGMIPPDRLISEVPAAAVTVPPHEEVVTVVLTVRPVGNVSVKDAPVAATPSRFLNVNVRVEVPPVAIGLGEKTLSIVCEGRQPVNLTLVIPAQALPPELA